MPLLTPFCSRKFRWVGTPTSPTSFDGLRLPVPSSEIFLNIYILYLFIILCNIFSKNVYNFLCLFFKNIANNYLLCGFTFVVICLCFDFFVLSCSVFDNFILFTCSTINVVILSISFTSTNDTASL